MVWTADGENEMVLKLGKEPSGKRERYEVKISPISS